MGRMVMIYPEQVVFLNDRNVIELTAIVTGQPNAVGGTLSFTNGQDTVQLSYDSERPSMLFDLYSVLKKLAGDNYATVTVSGIVNCGGNSTNITSFTMNVSPGRTLHSRSHNAEQIAYYYDYTELYDFEILSLNGGTVGQFTVTPGVNKLNLGYHSGDFNLNITDGQDTRVLHLKQTAAGGETDVPGAECADGEESEYGYIEVMYRNTDGCRRYLKGKVNSRKRSVEQLEWRANDIVRNTPNAMITGHTDEITLGFPSVERLAYGEDIMFSNEIWYRNEDGEWMPCTMASKSLDLKKWDRNDIEITLKTLA